MSAIVEKVTPVISPIVAEAGCELVDIEYVKEGSHWYLRVYADKPGGIDLNDCTHISELVSEALDAMDTDPFPKAYFLEVSSPGVERPLKSENDFEEVIDQYIHLDYYTPQHGEKSHEGYLREFNEETVMIEVMIKTRKKQLEIPRQAIAKARLAIDM